MTTPTNTYALSSIVKSPRGAFKADLCENGVVIAHVTRPAPTKSFVAPYSAKFLSSAALSRFDNACDSLFIADALEILAE